MHPNTYQRWAVCFDKQCNSWIERSDVGTPDVKVNFQIKLRTMHVFWDIKERLESCFEIVHNIVNRAALIMAIIILSKHSSIGQISQKVNCIRISCYLPETIKDSLGLKAKIVVANMSDTVIKVSSNLTPGMFNDIFDDNKVNLEFVVEQKTREGFQAYLGSFFDPAPNSDSATEPSLVLLNPRDSIVGFFHIDDRYTFKVGDYRIKCRYWRDVHKNYSIESNWTYFKIVNPVYAHRYFGE